MDLQCNLRVVLLHHTRLNSDLSQAILNGIRHSRRNTKALRIKDLRTKCLHSHTPFNSPQTRDRILPSLLLFIQRIANILLLIMQTKANELRWYRAYKNHDPAYRALQYLKDNLASLPEVERDGLQIRRDPLQECSTLLIVPRWNPSALYYNLRNHLLPRRWPRTNLQNPSLNQRNLFPSVGRSVRERAALRLLYLPVPTGVNLLYHMPTSFRWTIMSRKRLQHHSLYLSVLMMRLVIQRQTSFCQTFGADPRILPRLLLGNENAKIVSSRLGF